MADTPKAGTIQLPGVDFAELARHAIAQKITEAMVGADDQIRAICAAALAVKVDCEGKIDTYNAKTPYVEYLTGQLIRKAAADALKKNIDALAPAIEAEVAKALKASAKDTAHALTASFLDSCKKDYLLRGVEVKFNIRDPRS